jgi:hypothetical protein
MSLFKWHADGGKSHSGIPGSSASDRVDAAMQAAKLFALQSAHSEVDVSRALERLRRGAEQGPIIWELYTGLLGFLKTVFPGIGNSRLYGQIFDREPKGRGAHFDVYDEFLHPDFPWVALFNLSGDAVVSVCRLPDSLGVRYSLAHPEATDEAYEARRRIAEEALTDPGAHPDKGHLFSECGLIIPQQRDGPDWIHNIVPMDERNPGRFAKFAVTKDDTRHLYQRGYDLVNDLLRHALLLAPAPGSQASEGKPRRRCNLD